MALKDALNRSNPNTLADELRTVKLGAILRGQLTQSLMRAVPATADVNKPSGTAIHTLVLPEDARAAAVTRAYARVGTVTGELTPDGAPYAAPASAHIAVQPDGNIAVLAADAITDVDVVYTPLRGDVVVLPEMAVASNSLALPKSVTVPGVLLLISAVATAGTVTGTKHINKPAATNTTTLTASLDVAKTHVLFDSGTDLVTKAIVTVLVVTGDDLGKLLEANETEV